MNAFAWFVQAEGSACWRMWQRRCRAWRPEWSSWKRYLRSVHPSSALWQCLTLTLPPPVQKLQLVLAPFTSVFPLSLDDGFSEKTTLLSHSFQQLDRIDSLSEQIGFLEERLGTCEWWQITDPVCTQRVIEYLVTSSQKTCFFKKMWSIKNQTQVIEMNWNVDIIRNPLRNYTFSSFLQVPVQRISLWRRTWPRMFSPKELLPLKTRAVRHFSTTPCTSPDVVTVLSAGLAPSLRHPSDIGGSNCPFLFLLQRVLNRCSCVLAVPGRTWTSVFIYLNYGYL